MKNELPSPTDHWIVDILAEPKETCPEFSNWSICKVPTELRSVNEDAYIPHVVSIGPIHHGVEKLKRMEDYKRLFLRSLFNRTTSPAKVLKERYEIILGGIPDVRSCYFDPIVIDLDDSEIAKILLHDAGFMLELFFTFFEKPSGEQSNPIFTPRMIVTLQRDLVLLENQIPWIVLKDLFDGIKSLLKDPPTLERLVLKFFRSFLNIGDETLFIERCGKECNHLLHLLHNCYHPPDTKNSTSDEVGWEIIPCATSLRQAGVAFQKSTTNDLFNLIFKDGKFKIPPLLFQRNTDSLFRNLVAFEHCKELSEQYVTSYIMLMDRLIDTADDVKLLQQERIIQGYLGREDDVRKLFNIYGQQRVRQKFYYAGLCMNVTAYANHPWQRSKAASQRYIAELRRDNCKNPWTIISVVAAAILLVLTLLQTIYTMSSFYQS